MEVQKVSSSGSGGNVGRREEAGRTKVPWHRFLKTHSVSVRGEHRLGGHQSAQQPRRGWGLRLEGHLGLEDAETKAQIL